SLEFDVGGPPPSPGSVSALAARSHSASVGRRLPRQVQNARAANHETNVTGELAAAPGSVSDAKSARYASSAKSRFTRERCQAALPRTKSANAWRLTGAGSRRNGATGVSTAFPPRLKNERYVPAGTSSIVSSPGGASPHDVSEARYTAWRGEESGLAGDARPSSCGAG